MNFHNFFQSGAFREETAHYRFDLKGNCFIACQSSLSNLLRCLGLDKCVGWREHSTNSVILPELLVEQKNCDAVSVHQSKPTAQAADSKQTSALFPTLELIKPHECN